MNTTVNYARLSLCGAAALLLSISSAARADEPTTPELRHPLLTEQARNVIAERPELSDKDVFRNLHVFEWVREDANGTVETFSGVEWVDPETNRTAWTHEPIAAVFELHPAVEDFLVEEATSNAIIDVWLSTWQGWQVQGTVPYQQSLAMIRGEVSTQADLDELRLQWLEDRDTASDEALGSVVDQIMQSGADLVDWSDLAGVYRVRADAGTLSELLTNPLVTGAEPHEEDVLNGAGLYYPVTNGPVNGREAGDLTQLYPFYLGGYYGAAADTMVVAEGYADLIYSGHPMFLDSMSSTRLPTCDGIDFDCDITTSSGSSHATASASMAFGDLTLGQDAYITDATARDEHSFAARRAYGYGVGTVYLDYTEDVLVGDPNIKVVTRSSSSGADPNCNGNSSSDRYWHTFFEAGIAFFNSAHNSDHASPYTDCSVQAPNAGQGIFSVSSYVLSGSSSSNSYISMYTGAARGGVVGGEGAGRPIISAVGPGYNSYTGQETPSTPETYGSGTWGSSVATPYIAGTAQVFRDWYLTEKTSLIDDPQILYVNMYLQGNRAGETPNPANFTESNFVYRTSGLDSLTGAGIIRARRFDSAGLDSPALWGTGSVCVPEGSTYTINMNSGNNLAAGVEYFKVATHLYDAAHDDSGQGGSTFNQVDLRLEYYDPGLSAWTVAVSDTTTSEKKMVFYSGSFADDGLKWRVVLTGNATYPHSDPQCGADYQLVYYAIVGEENNRNDDATMTNYQRPEEL